MKKVQHEFFYSAPSMHNNFKHAFSFKMVWRGQQYGSFLLFSNREFDYRPFFCLRMLLQEKHYLLEQMQFVEAHELER